MKVRLTGEWKGVPAGTVVEVTPGRASVLRRMGVAKPVGQKRKRSTTTAKKRSTVKENTDSVTGSEETSNQQDQAGTGSDDGD